MSGERKRAKLYGIYWTVMGIAEGRVTAQKVVERGDPFDDSRFASGNYFLSGRAARARAKAYNREHSLENARAYSRTKYYERKNKS